MKQWIAVAGGGLFVLILLFVAGSTGLINPLVFDVLALALFVAFIAVLGYFLDRQFHPR